MLNAGASQVSGMGLSKMQAGMLKLPLYRCTPVYLFKATNVAPDPCMQYPQCDLGSVWRYLQGLGRLRNVESDRREGRGALSKGGCRPITGQASGGKTRRREGRGRRVWRGRRHGGAEHGNSEAKRTVRTYVHPECLSRPNKLAPCTDLGAVR